MPQGHTTATDYLVISLLLLPDYWLRFIKILEEALIVAPGLRENGVELRARRTFQAFKVSRM
jgi:hypothetical protein